MTAIFDELRIALHSIWQRRWLALALAWALAIVGWLGVSLVPNSYESRARMLVNINTVLPDISEDASDQRQQIDEVRQTLTSTRNLEKVAVATGMVQPGAGDREKSDKVQDLKNSIKIDQQVDNIFQIRAIIGANGVSDAENARLATAVVDNLIAIFRDEQVRGGRFNARESLQFLDNQLAEREKTLRQAEADRVAFETRNFGLLPGGQSVGAQLETARAGLADIDAQLVTAQAAAQSLTGQLASTPTTINVPGAGLGVAGVSAVKQQLAAAQGELTGARLRGLTDEHPDIQALKRQIAALQSQAAREPTASAANAGDSSMPNPAYAALRQNLAERQAAISGLQQRRATLQAQIASMSSRQTLEPQIAAESERINRDYQVLKNKYDELLAQRERVKLRGDVQSETDAVQVRVLDPASKPRRPIAPNRPLLLAGVLFGALAGGAGAAFALGLIQGTYPTVRRLETATGLPVIGSVSQIVSDTDRAAARKQNRWLLGGLAGLAGMFILLLAVELIQRSMVG